VVEPEMVVLQISIAGEHKHPDRADKDHQDADHKPGDWSTSTPVLNEKGKKEVLKRERGKFLENQILLIKKR
jgi:hypothetical protein